MPASSPTIPATLVTLGDLSKPQAWLAAAGFLLIAGLGVRKVPGAIILGVLAVTLAAVLLGLQPWHGVVAAPPSLAPTFLDGPCRRVPRSFVTICSRFCSSPCSTRRAP